MATKTAPAKKAARTAKAGRLPITEADRKLFEKVKALSFLTPSEKRSWEERLTDPHRHEYLSKAPTKAPSIEQYALEPKEMPVYATPQVHESVYDAKRKQWNVADGEYNMYEMLDTLAFMCAKGTLNSRTWVVEVFKTREAWAGFLGELAGYEQCYRIHDPWYFALARLAESANNEERFSTAEDIAETLEEHAEETGQFAQLD
jgi:hypothetical protein